MREPYRTLFEPYRDHWLLAGYLRGEEPDWVGLNADDRLELLSTGEKIFLYMAGAFAPGGDFDRLDTNHRLVIAQALLLTAS